MILMSAPSMEGELKIMIKDTDKKKEAMTRIEMRISKEDKAIIEQKARKTGLTTSEFVRRSALGRRFRVMEIPHFYRNILCSLVRLVRI